MDYGSIAAGMGLGALGSALGGLGAWVVSRNLRLQLRWAQQAMEFGNQYNDLRAKLEERTELECRDLKEKLAAAHAALDTAGTERDAAKRAVTAAEEGLAEGAGVLADPLKKAVAAARAGAEALENMELVKRTS
jgi:hypothetical protein